MKKELLFKGVLCFLVGVIAQLAFGSSWPVLIIACIIGLLIGAA